MKKSLPIVIAFIAVSLAAASAQVPSILNYQGRVTVGGTNFNGIGQFKFALVRNDNTFVWRNDGATTSGEPAAAVDALVQQGLYSTLLGDTTLSNMAAIPAEVFTNSNIGLRVWFSAGGTNPFVLLTPDQRIGSAGYALRAASAESAAMANVTGDLSVGGTLRAGKVIGGTNNTSSLNGTGAVIAGGEYNTANFPYATIGGGQGNEARTNATIAGGLFNTAWGDTAAIGGGFFNYSMGQYSTVSGGYANTASGEGSTVPGGQYNTAAGTNSIAMGYRAKATNDGALVWADSSADEDFSSTTNNQFSVRAAGGVRFVTGGAGISIDGTRVVTETGLSNITSEIGLSGAFRIAGGNPGPGRVLVSDASGYVSWRPLEEVAAMNQYTYTPQPFTENIAEIGISGVLTNNINVSVVNGPGFVVERAVGGNPYQIGMDYPGLSREMDFVFDYSGPMETALAAWQASGNTATITLPAKEFGSPVYTWTLSNYRLSTINPAPSGGKRYTLVHAGSPDGTLDAVRDNYWRDNGWFSGPAGVPMMEIEGVITGLYPEPVVVDEAQKTITITATYGNGGQLFMWAKAIAQQSPELKASSLIYQNWSTDPLNRRELGRNNFYGLFPISYQQISGFTPGTLGKERLVLAYGRAENVTTISPALYAPPTFNYYTAEGGDVLTRDPIANRFYLEIEGVVQAPDDPATWPILIQGPGFSIERFGAGTATSGVNRPYPFIFDVPTGGIIANQIAFWRRTILNDLPEDFSRKAGTLIVFPQGSRGIGAEAYRCNFFEMICKSMVDLGDGYTRVTLATSKSPDNYTRVELDTVSWGNSASMNNSATDTRTEIDSIQSSFYPQVTVDTAAKTLTMYFDYGEGGNIFAWARNTVWQGSGLTKVALTVDHPGATTRYYNCFPIAWQLVSGVERAARSKQKVVISYDNSEVFQ
jgi:hypothetical protein